MKPLKTFSASNRYPLISNLLKMVMKDIPHKAKSMEPQLFDLQTAEKHYALAVDYQTYRFSKWFLRYNKTISSYIAKLAKKIKLQIKAPLFNPKNPTCITRFIATFILAYEASYIHERAAMSLLPHFVHEMPADALNSRLYAKNCLTSLAATLRKQELRSQKILWSYPEMITYLQKTFVTDQAIAEYRASIPRYMQPLSMNSQQYDAAVWWQNYL